MHAALDIPELLLNIFSYLNSSKDLYRCIRVCRSFSGPAVEVLWQNGPVPLQALLNQFGRSVLPIIPVSEDDILTYQLSSQSSALIV